MADEDSIMGSDLNEEEEDDDETFGRAATEAADFFEGFLGDGSGGSLATQYHQNQRRQQWSLQRRAVQNLLCS